MKTLLNLIKLQSMAMPELNFLSATLRYNCRKSLAWLFIQSCAEWLHHQGILLLTFKNQHCVDQFGFLLKGLEFSSPEWRKHTPYIKAIFLPDFSHRCQIIRTLNSSEELSRILAGAKNFSLAGGPAKIYQVRKKWK